MTLLWRSSTLLLLLTLISAGLFSQKEYKTIPKGWFKPSWSGSFDSTSNMSSIWIVFSDRDNNPTYDGARSRDIFKTINFMEPFFVLETDNSGKWIHIFKDNRSAIQHGQSVNAEDYGWIEIDRLLPNNRCYLNNQTVAIKAILLNTTASAWGDISKKDFEKVKFYKDPELTIVADYECDIYQIFHIYDQYPNTHPRKSYLLGMNPKFEPFSERSNIKGWVDASRLTLWNHRVAVIPNARPEPVAERKSKNVKAAIFKSEQEAQKFRNGDKGYPDYAIGRGDQFRVQEQILPQEPRNPVIFNTKDINQYQGIMKIGYISEVESQSGSGKISNPEMAEVHIEYNETRVNARQVNVLFVIDGTQSMGPYFAGVANALTESMHQLQNYSANKYRFAAAIYRDKDDGEELLFEHKGLTQNYNEVSSWLKTRRAISTNDKDLPEAMYYGLQEALRRVNLPVNDQTNYVFLIGDTKDHGRVGDWTYVLQTEVVEMLNRNNCYFSAIQVNNQLTPEFKGFQDQCKVLMNAVSQYQYKKGVNMAKSAGMPVPPAPQWGIDTERRFFMNNPIYPGFIRYCYNSSLAPAEVTKEITNCMKNLDVSNTDGIKTMQTFVETGGLKTEAPTNMQLAYLSRMENIPMANLRILAENHVQLYYEGYTSTDSKLLSHPVWQYEILCTSDDLHDIINYLEKIDDQDGNDTDLRESFVNAWSVILKSTLGELKENAENMTVAELEILLFGSVGTTPLLEYKLGDFLDPSKISIKQLRDFKISISQNKRILKYIYEGVNESLKKKYEWISNERKFFWIPQYLLP